MNNFNGNKDKLTKRSPSQSRLAEESLTGNMLGKRNSFLRSLFRVQVAVFVSMGKGLAMGGLFVWKHAEEELAQHATMKGQGF
eukprot:3166970-Amphidinium_carterae.1